MSSWTHTKNKKVQNESSSRVNSERMDEALRLRQAMQKSNTSYMKRKQLINELQSPRGEVEHQFDDDDDNDDGASAGGREKDDDFPVSTLGASQFDVENVDPNLSVLRRSRRSRLLEKVFAIEFKDPPTPSSRASAAPVSIPSKLFQDQLSARFKSITSKAPKPTPLESDDEDRE